MLSIRPSFLILHSLVSILIGEDILMRSYSVDDAPLLFSAVDANRAHLRPWLNWVDKTTKQEHSLLYIQQSLLDQKNQEGIVLGIFHERRVIGSIGMHQWDQEIKKATIGYWIAEEYEGTGLLSQCLTRFVDFLFKQVLLNKIEIHFIPANTRSARVAERLNCKTEGILRQSTLYNGRLEDIVITGLLKEEWMAR
jgi:ribosomal-protein-serine acetyltransferase